MWIGILGFVVSTIVCFALTGVLRSQLLRRGMLDVPNARSSHQRPTPRGGGIAIVFVSLVSVAILLVTDRAPAPLCYAMLGGGSAVALAGYLDDRGKIGIPLRFAIHIVAALWALFWLGGFTRVQSGDVVFQIGFWGPILAVLVLVWSLNLFNFMDGIDGLAASQSAYMAGAGSVLGMLGVLPPSVAGVSMTLAAASLGFLIWNWPPARIFMGDVGSGFLGFALALLALESGRENVSNLAVWAILGGAFAVDATFTLLRRLARGEAIYKAHRQHAYQWQARRLGNHRSVTLGFLAINLIWLTPCALFVPAHPGIAGWILPVAWAPLVALAVFCGSGRPEPEPGPPRSG